MTTRPFECAPDYHGGMTEQEWTLVYQTEQDTGSGLVTRSAPSSTMQSTTA
jgi:hypothetical protein